LVREPGAQLLAAAAMAAIAEVKAAAAEVLSVAVVVAAEARVVDSVVDPLAVAEARVIATR